MAEADVFERRLASALVGYAGEVSGAVDAAAVAHRVAMEHPHLRAPLIRRRLATGPWAAWVPLLLGALLIAMVAGAVVVGSRLLAVVPPVGPAIACPPGSTPDEPGPAGQTRPRLDRQTSVAFDRRAGRLVALAWPTETDAPTTWTFDVCTNAWTQMAPDRQPTQRLQLVYASDADLTIGVATAGTWAYDLKADTWTEKTAPPVSGAFRIVYDPTTGHVLAWALDRAPTRWWTYDVETDTWTEIPQRGGNVPPQYEDWDNQLIAFDSAVDRVTVYQPGTSRFDPNAGTWSTSSGPTPGVNTGYWASGGEIAFDEATRRTVVFSDGLVIAYDAAADTWEVLWDSTSGSGRHGGTFFRCCGTGPQARLGHMMVYDPLNERLVVLGGSYRTDLTLVEDPGDVWAFDPGTAEWLPLLAPTKP